MALIPELPRHLLEAIEQHERLMKAAGVDKILQQVADADRLQRQLYGPWDAIARLELDVGRLDEFAAGIGKLDAYAAGAGKAFATMQQMVTAAGITREILDQGIGPMLRAADAYSSAMGPMMSGAAIEAARGAFSPAAIGISKAAESLAREALSGIAIGLSEDVQRALSAEWLDISSKLADYGARWLEGLHLPSEGEMQEDHRAQIAAASALAEHGWTVPLAFSPRQVDEAIAMGRERGLSALDEDMVALYSEEDNREFETLAATLRSRYAAKKRRRWYPFVVECLSSYKAGHYRAAALIAIPLLERSVADVVGIENMGGRYPTLKHYTWNRWKAERDAERPPRNFFVDALSCSIGHFIACTWQDSSFRVPQPEQPNRHRAVHGRDPEFGSQADALRLLIALDTLGHVTSESRRQDYARKRGRR
jgi:hypothetical protein